MQGLALEALGNLGETYLKGLTCTAVASSHGPRRFPSIDCSHLSAARKLSSSTPLSAHWGPALALSVHRPEPRDAASGAAGAAAAGAAGLAHRGRAEASPLWCHPRPCHPGCVWMALILPVQRLPHVYISHYLRACNWCGLCARIIVMALHHRHGVASSYRRRPSTVSALSVPTLSCICSPRGERSGEAGRWQSARLRPRAAHPGHGRRRHEGKAVSRPAAE